MYIHIHMYMYMYICVWRGSCMSVTWRTHACYVTHSYVWQEQRARSLLDRSMAWLVHMCDMTHSYVWRDLFICVTWTTHIFSSRCVYGMTDLASVHIVDTLRVCVWVSVRVRVTCIYMCDMFHACVEHDSFTCVTWLIYLCDMTHSSVWHDSSICGKVLLYMCDITHSHVWHNSFLVCHDSPWSHVTFLPPPKRAPPPTIKNVWRNSCMCVTWLLHVCDMTHLYVWHDSIIRVTWFTSVLCFPKRATRIQFKKVWRDSFTHVAWLIHVCG